MTRTYISNGTMGEMWMAQNCYRCTKEDADNEQYCPVLSALMMHEYPIEGLHDWRRLALYAFAALMFAGGYWLLTSTAMLNMRLGGVMFFAAWFVVVLDVTRGRR